MAFRYPFAVVFKKRHHYSLGYPYRDPRTCAVGTGALNYHLRAERDRSRSPACRCSPRFGRLTWTGSSLCVFFLRPGAAEDVGQTVIAFMTGKLINRAKGRPHRQLHAPGLGPRGRIFHRELVQDRVLAGAREALHHVEILARSAEVGLAREIRGGHNERVALPAAS